MVTGYPNCEFCVLYLHEPSSHAPSLDAFIPDSIGMLPTQDLSPVNLNFPLMIAYILIHGLADTAL